MNELIRIITTNATAHPLTTAPGSGSPNSNSNHTPFSLTALPAGANLNAVVSPTGSPSFLRVLLMSSSSSISDHGFRRIFVPGAPSSDEVTALLTSLNLQQYIGAFVANDIVTMPRLKSMQESHFRMLGVSLGHQFDIVNRIQSASNSSGLAQFPLVGHLNAAAIAPSEPGCARDQNSGQPNSKRRCFGIVDNPFVESGSNLVASSQAAPSESSIYSNEVSHSVANVVSASELAIVDSNALNSSHASAMYQRALILEDPIQASRWFHCAAELGNADAVLKIAKQFEPDDCDENSSLEAVSWFRRAAELGEITAMFKLGICYEKGIGVVKDLQQAVVWYRQAADLGHANAMCNLAAVLKNGIGIAKDASAAVSWYQRAAELGHVGAINVIDSINGLEPPSSSVASVSGTKNGIIAAAAKKTKRTRTQWNESYRSSIHQVLKQVHPDKSISKKGMAVVNSIMNDMFVRIASEAGKLAQYNGKSILTSREIQIAVRLLLTGTLSKFAVSDGKKTMIRYRNSSQ